MGSATDGDLLYRLFTGDDHSDLIAVSTQMKELFDGVRDVAPEITNVLIEGETGTGKKLLALAIHAHSPRQKGPFVVLNLQELNEMLLQSELFGHARGAFTGAESDKAGLVEFAQGGTLFLDEINKTDISTQRRILRLAADREYRRVGETRIRKADIAIIAASNTDLWAEVKAGRFLGDLFFRLKVHFLRIPPLRERAVDIRPLLTHFMGEHARKFGKVVPELGAQAWRLLLGHPWYGNVRELENSVATIFSWARSGHSDVEKLQSYLSPGPLPGVESQGMEGSPPIPGAEPCLKDPKITATVAELRRARGNVTLAAQALGITRQAVHYRIRHWDLRNSW